MTTVLRPCQALPQDHSVTMLPYRCKFVFGLVALQPPLTLNSTPLQELLCGISVQIGTVRHTSILETDGLDDGHLHISACAQVQEPCCAVMPRTKRCSLLKASPKLLLTTSDSCIQPGSFCVGAPPPCRKPSSAQWPNSCAFPYLQFALPCMLHRKRHCLLWHKMRGMRSTCRGLSGPRESISM